MGCCLLLPVVAYCYKESGWEREKEEKKWFWRKTKVVFKAGKWFWKKVVFGEVLSRGDRVNER